MYLYVLILLCAMDTSIHGFVCLSNSGTDNSTYINIRTSMTLVITVTISMSYLHCSLYLRLFVYLDVYVYDYMCIDTGRC
jgi:hypothetical protein